jgi:hypothetical protein
MTDIYYYTKSAYVNENGKITGKQLIAYEVAVEKNDSIAWSRRYNATPSGISYKMDANGNLIKRKSKPIQSFTTWTNSAKTTVSNHAGWGGDFYESPELALCAKALKLRKDAAGIKAKLQKQIDLIDQAASEVKFLTKYLDKFPEHKL